VLSEIYTTVQTHYKGITGGKTLDVDFIKARGNSYFRNKKYNTAHKSGKKRRNSENKDPRVAKRKKQQADEPVAAAPEPTVQAPVPAPILAEAPTLLNSPAAITPVALLPPIQLPEQPEQPQTLSPVTQQPQPPVTLPPVTQQLPEQPNQVPFDVKSVQEGNKVLIRCENNNYWPAIIRTINGDDISIVWLVPLKGQKARHKLGDKADFNLDTIVGKLPDIQMQGKGAAARFDFAESTFVAIEAMKATD